MMFNSQGVPGKACFSQTLGSLRLKKLETHTSNCAIQLKHLGLFDKGVYALNPETIYVNVFTTQVGYIGEHGPGMIMEYC